MNKKILMIFIGIILLFSITFIIWKVINKDSLDYVSIDNYFIHYYNYDSNTLYDIETKKENILIKESYIVFCITDPCNPILNRVYSVKYKDEYINFMEELFKDKKVNEITIQDKDLNNKQIDILSKIINEK